MIVCQKSSANTFHTKGANKTRETFNLMMVEAIEHLSSLLHSCKQIIDEENKQGTENSFIGNITLVGFSKVQVGQINILLKD